MDQAITDKWLTTLIIGFAVLFAHIPESSGWTFTADFEQGMIGEKANGPSGLSGARLQTLYSDERSNTGTQSAKVTFIEGTNADKSGGRVQFSSLLGEGDELWARGYFYFKSPWSWTCSPVIKILRGARVKTGSGDHIGYLSIFSNTNGTILLSNEVHATQPGTGANFDLDRWQIIEMYIKFSTMAPIFRIWKDGVLIIEDQTYRTLNNTTDVADFSYIFTYWNGNVPQDQVNYIDDFVFTTDRPSNQDDHGNYMIGPIGESTDESPPLAPKNLAVQ